MKLITEMSYDFELYEDKNSKDMFAVGIFSSAELKNNNKRIYKKNLLEREIEKVNEKVNKKCLWGELGHPPNPEVNPDKIAIRTTKLEWRGNDLYGKAKILDTPMGNIAKTLVKEGQMGISSRGLGTVGDDGYVNEDFHLITWDLVTDPSNNPSWVNGIYEGCEFQTIGGIDGGTLDTKQEPTEDDIKEAQKAYYDYLMSTLDNIIVSESYASGELKSLNNNKTINAQFRDYDGNKTKWLGLNNKESLMSVKKFIDSRIKNLKTIEFFLKS